MNKRYVVDEDGERVAILLEIDDYKRLLAQHRAPTADDELPIDGEVLDPEESERRITEFIASAEKLPGLPVAELANRISELMRATWRDVETIISACPNNKILAVELFLGQRARGLQPDDPEQWRLHAATSLLSGIHLGKVDKRA